MKKVFTLLMILIISVFGLSFVATSAQADESEVNEYGPFVPNVPAQITLPTVVCDDTDLRGLPLIPEQVQGVTHVQTTGMSEAGWASTFTAPAVHPFEDGSTTKTIYTPYFGSLCEVEASPVVEEPVKPEAETSTESYPAPETVVNMPVEEQPATTVQEPVKRNEGFNIQSAAKQDLPDELANTGLNGGLLVIGIILITLGVVGMVSFRPRK